MIDEGAPKKSCGHEVGYRCLCHPLALKRRKSADLVDVMRQPIGAQLAGLEREDAGPLVGDDTDDPE